jgi:hypothetical protein
MLVKSPITLMPVLGGGLVAGVTVTVSKTLLLGSTEEGLDEPTAPSWLGSPPQVFTVELPLRGMGPETVKSLELTSVSWQPALFLMAAVVLLKPPVGEVSEQVAVLP